MQRVAVIGCGGAGKSTLARRLGHRLALPVVHLDAHYWRPGWRPADPAAWRSLQESLVAADSWVIDGNYLGTLEVRLNAADTVVFLDLPAWRCAWWASLRVLRGRGGANTAPGCPERLARRHLRFLRYIWRFRRTARPQVIERLAEHGQAKTIVRLTTPSEIRRFEAALAPRGRAVEGRDTLRGHTNGSTDRQDAARSAPIPPLSARGGRDGPRSTPEPPPKLRSTRPPENRPRAPSPPTR